MELIALPQRDAPHGSAQTIEEPAPFCWTDTAVARLRHLWAIGRSLAQIAREIGGLSRSAVVGKVHRLGLRGRRAAAAREPRSISAVPHCAPPVSEVSRAERARLQRERVRARRQAFEQACGPCPAPAPPETPPPARRPCSLLELNRDTCRWPIGDPGTEGFHFCGAPPDAGHPYCAHHRRIAHWDPFAPGTT